jgi:hypothetical protein
MAQITVDTPSHRAPTPTPTRRDPRPPDRAVERDRDADGHDDGWQRVRSTAPVAVAVSLLFGVVMAAALALRDVLDLGVWLLSGS